MSQGLTPVFVSCGINVGIPQEPFRQCPPSGDDAGGPRAVAMGSDD